jgi:hypothetical protein
MPGCCSAPPHEGGRRTKSAGCPGTHQAKHRGTSMPLEKQATLLPWLVRRDRPDLALAEGPEARPSIRPRKDPPCESFALTVHCCVHAGSDERRGGASDRGGPGTRRPVRHWPGFRKLLRPAREPDILRPSREIARVRERNRHTPPVRDQLVLRTGFCVLTVHGIAQYRRWTSRPDAEGPE